MSVKVNSVSYSNKPEYTSQKEHHVYKNDVYVTVSVEKSDVVVKLRFRILPGFKCDGASIPFAFRWFLPSWDKNNDLYNLGSSIHDGLYLHGGFGILSREECDDVLRGIWRDSGISRFKAGVADKCVEWFAGGGKHWGNDSYGVKDLFKMEVV